MCPDLNGGPPFDRRGAAPLPAGAAATFVLPLTICNVWSLLSTATLPTTSPGKRHTGSNHCGGARLSSWNWYKQHGEKTHWAWSHNGLQQGSCGRLARLNRLARLRLGLLWLACAALGAAGLLRSHSRCRTRCCLIGQTQLFMPACLPLSGWHRSGSMWTCVGGSLMMNYIRHLAIPLMQQAGLSL